MSKFFDYFPNIPYDIEGKQRTDYNFVTDIFFRTRFLRSIISNISAYYEHVLDDTDTPETLAEKVYGDAESHWVILYANDMVDPQYDWPLNTKDFKNYIISKYGSIANAQTQIHHYEKIITRTEEFTGIETELKYNIDYEPKEDYEIRSTILISGSETFSNNETVFCGLTGANAAYSNANFSAIVESNNHPYYTLKSITPSNTSNLIFGSVLKSANTSNSAIIAGSRALDGTLYLNGSIFFDTGLDYDTYINLPEVQYVETFNWGAANSTTTDSTILGKTVTQITRRNVVSCYDYELGLNDAKRTIKVIKREYYLPIIQEFKGLTEGNRNVLPYRRRLT